MRVVHKFDVVVVGAGPAGAWLAYRLARTNLDVLLLEKQTLPRYKACGGGLTTRACGILPFDLGDVIEDEIFTAETYLSGRLFARITVDDPMIRMVMRERFDHLLVEKAVAAGASLRDGTAFEHAGGAAGDLTVQTSKGRIRARVIVGADGVHSRVGRSLGLWTHRECMAALVGEVFHKQASRVPSFAHKVHYDFGVIPGGYGWVFPKGEHLTVGVLSHAGKAGGLSHLFDSYLGMKKLDSGAEVRAVRGHLIPAGPPKNMRFANQRGLLVGDAAGLADPMTGEGIYFALRESEIGSQVIWESLAANPRDLERYNSLMREEFVKELSYARRLAFLLYRCTIISHRALARSGQKLLGYHLDIILGLRCYKDLYGKIWRSPLSLVTGRV